MANIGRFRMKKRGLSPVFLEALKSGLLQPLLNRVKKDDTLMLAIRKNYINIYYRGGNILKITEKQDSFDLFFDINYDLSEGHKSYEALDLPNEIKNIAQTKKVVSSVAALKELMDFYISENPQMEREFQQLVERENNRSSLSGGTEYFITDIEYSDTDIGAKFDILAVKWPASPTSARKDGRNCSASFIEMKYGDKALSNKSGLIKHIGNHVQGQRGNAECRRKKSEVRGRKATLSVRHSAFCILHSAFLPVARLWQNMSLSRGCSWPPWAF